MVFYLTQEAGLPFTGDNVYNIVLTPQKNLRSYLVPDNATRFRINMNTFPKEGTFSNLALVADNDFSPLEKLAASPVENISLENDVYSADVSIENENGMFCIPILYDKNWSAVIDGIPSPIQNINGGMCGIALEKGRHHVELAYHNPYILISLIMTCVGIILYIAVLIISRTVSCRRRVEQ